MSIIFCDGAASGNPGPSGWAYLAYLEELDLVIELGSHLPTATNNQMELRAAIEALRLCTNKKINNNLQIYTDSKYLIEGITKWIFGWRKKHWFKSDGEPVANKELWQELDGFVSPLRSGIKWIYVPGHSGIAGNERVDQLAVAFSKNQDPDLFEGPLDSFSNPEWFRIDSEIKVQKFLKPKYLSFIDGAFHVYTSWAECEKAVKGKKNVKFKKIQTAEEEVFLRKKWSE